MNALDEKMRRFADRPAPTVGVVLAVLMLTAGQLGGCADVRRATSLPPVNPESPVAGVVAAAAMQNYKRPSLASVPPKPLNVPTAAVVKTAVIDMVRCRRAYQVWATTHPAQVSGTTAFADALQARLDNNLEDKPTPKDEAAAEAEAAKLRAYAAPPPALPTGPPLSASQAAAPAPPSPIAATPRPRPAHPAPVATAAPAATATAPASSSAASGAPAAVAQTPPPPATETVAVAQPSAAPLYNDPLLAHCQ